ncbi:MAG: helix-turn-helix transcriptional regulator [Erysipelotrichaceae bacterium]|nr:helix-turn-helix transcriptional regulator [Erysipelotrichaceae bacterium]
MKFNEYLKNELEKDVELKKEYDALQPEYEVIKELIKARNELKLTQSELAQMCGIKQSNISRLEKGKVSPTIKVLKKIADALNCDLVIEFRKRDSMVSSRVDVTGNENINTSILNRDLLSLNK